MAGDPKIYEDDFFRWLKTFLKDNNYQFSRNGFKGGEDLGSHRIDLTTGYWEDPKYSLSKPLRWLYHIEPNDGGWVAVNPADENYTIGFNNPGQKNDKTAIVFRVQPLVKQGPGDYALETGLEVHLFFLFHGPPQRGTSAQTYKFDPETGVLELNGAPLRYIAAGFLGIRPRDEETELTIGGAPRKITYGDVLDALSADVKASIDGSAPVEMPVFDLSEKQEFERLKRMIVDSWDASGPVPSPAPEGGAAIAEEEDDDDDEIIAPPSLQIPEDTDLIGIDPAVYRQINAALASGKQHIMLYGPPGTGKTTLARHIATVLTGGRWTLVTGSSDWSSQDIIGGYQPIGEGGVAFVPGVLLRRFDRPLIIDELNRCDIDKVLGPLFTVLSGQQTTLPYRLKIEEKDSPQFIILPKPNPTTEDHEFAPGPHWRLLATINSIDKAALYQMSYALARRFGWVYVDAPRDTVGFIEKYLRKDDPTWGGPAPGAPCPLGQFWAAINTVRVLGPAPVIDSIKAVQSMIEMPDFFAAPDAAMKDALLDAVDMVLLPMLDGIIVQDAEFLTGKAIEVFDLDGAQGERIKARMDSVAV